MVDNVNEKKKLFHYVIDYNLEGIVHFSKTRLRPKVGDVLNIKYFVTHNEKLNKKRLHSLSANLTTEKNPSLIRSVSGEIKLKYKNNSRTIDYQDIIDDEINIDTMKPDFGFINDYYVPKYLLKERHIVKDCNVEAKALFNGQKWAVFELNRL